MPMRQPSAVLSTNPPARIPCLPNSFCKFYTLLLDQVGSGVNAWALGYAGWASGAEM
jgi:hypothetical protein